MILGFGAALWMVLSSAFSPLSWKALGVPQICATRAGFAASMGVPARALTITSPTCSQADVQAAVDAAADGDTVQIPAGTCAWASRVSWINKSIFVRGAGKDVTTISCQDCFSVQSTSPTSAYSRWRLSGMTLQGSAPSGIQVNVYDNVSSWHYGWRIDDMKLDYPGAGSSGYGIFILGATYGVIDSNEFIYGNGNVVIVAAQMDDEYPASLTHPQGAYVLSQPLDMGTNKAVYIEDNTYTATAPGGLAVYDTSSGGGRAVFRHNTVMGGYYYSHWTRSLEIGGRLHEVYNNRFVGDASTYNYWPIRLESGTGVIFNNTVQNDENYAVFDERRGFLEDSPEFGACDGTKAWDGNAGDPAAPGWPCLGQIGRSSGKTMAQIMAGDKLESAPIYLWNNGAEEGCWTGGACTDSFGVSVYDGSPQATAYVRSTPHPNGDVDYVLNGSMPKPGYVPYTYPHPLRTGTAPSFRVDTAGNGVLEIGETAVVAPFWTNNEAADIGLTGTAANLTGPGGLTYAISDSTADYGVIPASTTSNCLDATGDCYAMSVAGPRPSQHLDLTFDETVMPGSTSKTWTLHVGNSFTDVSTDTAADPYYPAIETVFHNSVTAGCQSGTFCPTNPTSREQMAVFLLKSLQGSGYGPPACAGIFADVPCTPGSGFADWIEDLYGRGITAGCQGPGDPLAYCPGRDVLRSEMAVFLLKTSQGSGYHPPDCAGVFADVPCTPGSGFADWIEDLYGRGITGGCQAPGDPLAFCPGNHVLRQEMAVFLTKTFGLVLYGP